MSRTDPSSFLVRILNDQERPRLPLGDGFLVSDRYIITCAHVVCDALKLPKYFTEVPADPIILDFPLIEHQPTCTAKVFKWIACCEDPTIGNPEDIAVLKLMKGQSLPPQARPAPLVDSDDFFDCKIKMCGFPEGMDDGDHLDGETKGLTGKGWIQFNHEMASRCVAPGFSGTPVRNHKGAVIGMVVSKSDREGKISGYMIPTSTLIKVFPSLKPLSRSQNQNQRSGAENSKQTEELKERKPKTETNPTEPANKKPVPKYELELEDEIKFYRKKAEFMFDSIPLAGFATKLKVPIDIDDIYIPLRAMVNLKGIDDIVCYGDSQEAEKRLAKCNAGLEIPLLDAFSEAEKRGRKGLVILGDPGSGKTTHMKRMLLWCLRKGSETMGLSENMLPVFLPLREITHLKNGFEDYIQNQFTHHFKRSPDFGRRLLEQDNLLFLFDGLDEVSSLERREQVSAWIEKALTDYSGCRFVVTCRFAGYSPSVRLGEKFLEMHIRPLSEKDAEKFVRKWYAIVEKRLAIDTEQADTIARQKSDDLINRLAQPDFRARRVFELTRNPLLLTNICLLHRKQQGQLPTRRVPLYEECIQVMLELWRNVPELKNMVSGKKGIMVLQAAALWLHQEENRTRAAVSDLAPVIESVLKKQKCLESDAHKFLRTIRDESGLLTGWDQDYYGFMHLNFQEYLAAREIRSRFLLEKDETGTSGQLKELAKHFGDSWWQEVALLLLAIEEKPSLFVPYMREVIRNPAFAQHADFLEMCLDDAFKPSLIPFLELLGLPAGKAQDLWDRQLTALRILMRQDEKVRKSILERFRDHPDERISQ